MAIIALNPGSGPVNGATVEQAEANIRQFVADLTERGHLVEYERAAEHDADGRWAWTVDVDNSDNQRPRRELFGRGRGNRSEHPAVNHSRHLHDAATLCARFPHAERAS